MYNSKRKRNLFKIIVVSFVIFLISLTAFLVIYSNTLDYSVDETLFSAAKSSNVTKIYYDRENGAESLSSYVPELYEEIYGTTRKEWVEYSDIPESLKNTFISMEDRNFFEHSGVNVKRTFAAFLNYIFHFKGNFGGSTITQQVIKNISGDNERSIKRKINEIFRSVHIEKNHTKEEIFELYMNIVDLGDGIVGVSEGAEHYFGKNVGEIDYVEAATLVGMANAPTKYNPYKNPVLCKEKRNKVLYSLLECGYINKEYYDSVTVTELSVKERLSDRTNVSSWFTETLIDDASCALMEKLGISESVARKLLRTGGYKIFSTVSPPVQKILEEYFENTDNFPEAVARGLEFSMVISDVKSGNLMGIVGGVGQKNGERIINFAKTNITPASTLKPLALYAPLLDAKKIHWASVFDDVPVEFKKNASGLLTAFPKNSPDVYDGLTSVKDAVRVSKNTVAVRLYNMLGARNIYDNLYSNFNFDSLVEYEKRADGSVLTDLAASPLALGQLTKGVSLKKLTESYNVFPNYGELPKSRSFIAIFDSQGNLIFENARESKRVFSAETAKIMNKLLESVVEDGTAKKITLSELVDTAGKTGTSGGGYDKIFVGYTPYFTAGIWCGYRGKKQTVSFDSKNHLDIWNEVCRRVYDSFPPNEAELNFSTEGLENLPYCCDSGELFWENCLQDPRGCRMEYGFFTIDNSPKKTCERHVIIKYDKLGRGVACNLCPKEEVVDIALLKIEDRRFPYEIIITDAEYAVRDVGDNKEYPRSFSVPYFYESLPQGEYPGKSKGKKQFNSACYIHRE